ncbi:MAG: hypothetical protein ACRD0K_27270 [Egibacteraceae bacterium]
MTPMVGEDLKIGLDVDLLVVVAAPGNLRLDKSSSNEFEVLAVESVPSVPNGVAARREVHKRRWIALRGSFGPVWMAAGEFEIAEIAPVPGLMVTWEDARYDLYAWCPVAAA